MNLTETQLTCKTVFEGKILTVREDSVLLPSGHTATREVIEHNGGSCVAALTPDNRLLMVRQFRYAAGKALWEIPAGKLEKGEDPLVCAARELEEETGYKAKTLEPLGHFYPTPAYCQEVIYMYYTTSISPSAQHLDEDEFVEVAAIPFEEVLAMIDRGEITDGKTQLTVLKLKEVLQ